MAKNFRLCHQKKGLGSKWLAMDIPITTEWFTKAQSYKTKKKSLVCVGQTR